MVSGLQVSFISEERIEREFNLYSKICFTNKLKNVTISMKRHMQGTLDREIVIEVVTIKNLDRQGEKRWKTVVGMSVK